MAHAKILPCILLVRTKYNQSANGCPSIAMRLPFRTILTLAIGVFATFSATAQWGILPNIFQLSEIHNGLTGIGLCTAPSLLPVRMLSIHSDNFGNSTATVYHRTFLPLPSQSQNFGVNSNVNYFGQTGIDCISGSKQNKGAGSSCVRKILNLTNGRSFEPLLPKLLFRPNHLTEQDLQVEFAFLCSLSNTSGLPMETNREVMHIVNGVESIGTTKLPKLLQTYEKMTFHAGANDYYMRSNRSTQTEIVSLEPGLVLRHLWELPLIGAAAASDASPGSSALGVMFKEEHTNQNRTNHIMGLAESIIHLTETSCAVKRSTIGNTKNDIDNTREHSPIGLGAAADADSRVLIRGLRESCATMNVLRVANSGELYSTPFTRFVVADNATVGNDINAAKTKLPISARFGTYADTPSSIFTYNAYSRGAWKCILDGVTHRGKPAAIGLSDGTISLRVGTATGMQPDAASARATGLSIPNRGKVTIGSLAGSGASAVYSSARGELITTSDSCSWSLDGTTIGDNGFLNTMPLILKTNNKPFMQIAVNSDVHFGTLKWDYSGTARNLYQTVYPSLLSVNRSVAAKSFRVTVNNWADNVFSPNYRLMPLSEVKAFITKNGHLPDVPAEAEAKKNGIDLQEMQTVLLRKVEELTLHVIAIEEENKKLRCRVDAINASLPINEE